VDNWITLTNNQLELAVIDVQLTEITAPIAAEDGLRILNLAIQKGMPDVHVEPTERRDINVFLGEDGGPTVSNEVTAGWQYSAANVPFTAIVLPTSATLQTNHYQSFGTSLGRPFFALLQGIAEVLHPPAVSRLGLRYVNRLVDKHAVTPDFWVGRINEPLLGPVVTPTLSALTVTAQQQFELVLEGSVGATVRYGLISNGQQPALWNYLVDIDVYDSALTLLDPEETFNHARRLNATALALFHLVVTPTHRNTLGPGDVPPRTAVTQ